MKNEELLCSETAQQNSSFFVLHSSLLIRIFAQVIIFNIKGCKARNLSLPEHGFL